MYDEPYRWVEAVGNRRQYLDEQFRQGSPLVATSYAEGVLLLTASRGTPKLYEIYDRIGLGGMGHPADLEKLRMALLELAHVEGFNRSPSDVTGPRLVKYGLAPTIKQAFEEIYKAPYIVKMLLAELGHKVGRNAFLTVNYDGTFEESSGSAVVAATAVVQQEMRTALQGYEGVAEAALPNAFEAALFTWAVGSFRQRQERAVPDSEKAAAGEVSTGPDRGMVRDHLRDLLADGVQLECAVLERRLPGTSKYRSLTAEEVSTLLAEHVKA